MSKLNIVLQKISFWGAVGVIITAVLGLLGYIPGLRLLASLGADFIPMAPSTAICFLILSGILLFLPKTNIPGTRQRFLIALAALVTLFGGLEVLSFITGRDLNFENWLFPNFGMLDEIPVGRMSVSSGAVFLISGLAVIWMLLSRPESDRKSYLEYFSSGLGAVVLISSLVFCGAYLFGSPLLYGQGSTIPMALTTAISFWLLGTSIVAGSGENGIILRCLLKPFNGDKPFSDRRRFALLVGIMVAVASISAVILLTILFRHNFRQVEAQLQGIVQRHIQLIETITKHNLSEAEMIRDEIPDYDPYQAALKEVISAHANISELGQSVEFTLAQLRGDSIVFLQTQRRGKSISSPPIPMNTDFAQPQSQALAGESGIMIGLDYAGQKVLAAYGYENMLNLGIVVKIDMAEIKAPFIQATLLGILISGIFIVLGSLFFIWIGNPVMRRLQEHTKVLLDEISQRQQAEMVLSESESKYRALFESVSEAIFFYDPDTFEIHSANEATSIIYGYDRDELIGMSCLKFSAEVDQSKTAAAKIIENGQVAVDTRHHKKKDGSDLFVHLTGHKISVNGHDLFFSVCKDVTKRKQAQEALLESNALNEALLQTIPFGLNIVDLQGGLLYMNPAMKAMVGKTVQGELCWRIFKDNQQQCIDCPLKQSFRAGETKRIVTEGVLGERVFEISHTNMIYKDEPVLLEVFYDITDQKQLESQFRQSQKIEALGTLAGGIAHDFNNILQTQLLHAEIVQRQLPARSKLKTNLQHIINAGNHARDLVKGILAFSRVSTPQFSAVRMQDIVTETLNLLSSIFPANIQIESQIDINVPLVMGDPTNIQQILFNLCNNARQAMGQSGGVLSISLQRVSALEHEHQIAPDIPDNELIELRVSDTGCGMSEQTMSRIFDPFFTTKEVGEGTGLGLSVVHGIIGDMQGTIEVHSKEGKGSTFIVLLPTTQFQMQPHTVNMGTPDIQWEKRVLVVEDDTDILKVTKLILSTRGFQVITANSGIKALELFKVKPENYDIIITDHSMPNMTGLEFSKRVLDLKGGIPIILMSGYLDQALMAECLELGIRTIRKPWAESDLLKEIEATNLEQRK